MGRQHFFLFGEGSADIETSRRITVIYRVVIRWNMRPIDGHCHEMHRRCLKDENHLAPVKWVSPHLGKDRVSKYV